MAYKPGMLAVWVLNKPVHIGVAVLVCGLVSGWLFQNNFGNNLFERFGAMIVAFGAFLFGAVASELLVRGQATLIVGNDGEPGKPFKFAQMRKALNTQAAVVALGTLQWGFGGLLFDLGGSP